MTREEAIAAYFSTFSTQGFGAASIGYVAGRTGVSVAELHAAVGDRFAALDAFTHDADRTALGAVANDGGVRDRLFDLIMARFDASVPYKAAIIALDGEARRRPALALAALGTLPRTAELFLSAAGVNTIGPLGIARVQGLAVLLADVGRVWLKDDDIDQGATMRALDARLDQAERMIARLGRSAHKDEYMETATPV